jgi:hypothetical protein
VPYRVEAVVLAVPACLSRIGLLTRYYRPPPVTTTTTAATTNVTAAATPALQAQQQPHPNAESASTVAATDSSESGRPTPPPESPDSAAALPVRLTPRKVHDDSYVGLSASARFVDESDAIDHVVVVRRGNVVAWVGERPNSDLDGNDDNEKQQEGNIQLSWGRVAETLEYERRRPLTPDERRVLEADRAYVLSLGGDLADIDRLAEPLLAEADASFSELPPLKGPLAIASTEALADGPLTESLPVTERLLRLGVSWNSVTEALQPPSSEL